MKQVTEEMKPQEQWFEQAKQVKTVEELAAFAKELYEDTAHDYGTVCHAVGAVALAAAWLGAKIQGITGFQAGFVMWDFIKQWEFTRNETGLKIVDWDDMLYLQYEYKFRKTIPLNLWKNIQKAAYNHLLPVTEETRKTEWDSLGYQGCWSVREHWGSICRGVVPFDYVVLDDNDQVVNPVAYEEFTESLVHPKELEEELWKDYTSPAYDEERYNAMMAEYMKEKESEKEG